MDETTAEPVAPPAGVDDPCTRLCVQAQRLIELQRNREAIPLLGRACAADPTNYRPECLLSLAHFELGQFEEAQAAAERASALEPEEALPYALRSGALLGRKRKRAALEDARRAAELDPESPEILFNLVYCLLANRRRAEALDLSQLLVEEAPDLPRSHEVLARTLFEQRRWNQAEARYRRVLTLDPEDGYVLNDLAVAVQRQRRELEAIQLFHQAAAAEPGSELIRRNLHNAVFRFVGAGLVAPWLGFLFMPVSRFLFRHESEEFWRGFDRGFTEQAFVFTGVYFFISWRRLRKVHPEVVAFFVSEYPRWWYTRRPQLLTFAALLGATIAHTAALLSRLHGQTAAAVPAGLLALHAAMAVGTLVALGFLLRPQSKNLARP